MVNAHEGVMSANDEANDEAKAYNHHHHHVAQLMARISQDPTYCAFPLGKKPMGIFFLINLVIIIGYFAIISTNISIIFIIIIIIIYYYFYHYHHYYYYYYYYYYIKNTRLSEH